MFRSTPDTEIHLIQEAFKFKFIHYEIIFK